MTVSVQPPADGRRLWWRIGPELIWHREPGDTIVFDPASGETHFLTELPALLLSVVDRQPASQDDLVERLAGAVGLDDQARLQIASALLFLERAELVESRPEQADAGQWSPAPSHWSSSTT